VPTVDFSQFNRGIVAAYTGERGTFLAVRTSADAGDISGLSSAVSAFLGVGIVSQTLLDCHGPGLAADLGERIRSGFQRRLPLDSLLHALAEHDLRGSFQTSVSSFQLVLRTLAMAEGREAKSGIGALMDLGTGSLEREVWLNARPAPWETNQVPGVCGTPPVLTLFTLSSGPVYREVAAGDVEYQLASFVERIETPAGARFAASIRLSRDLWYRLDPNGEAESSGTRWEEAIIPLPVDLAFYLRRDRQTGKVAGFEQGRIAVHNLLPRMERAVDRRGLAECGSAWPVRAERDLEYGRLREPTGGEPEPEWPVRPIGDEPDAWNFDEEEDADE
jgi:hypothetical protein